jgi:hypothetical protein
MFCSTESGLDLNHPDIIVKHNCWILRKDHGYDANQSIEFIKERRIILTASWIPAAVRFATTLAGSAPGSRRRGSRGTATAGTAGLAAGTAATAAAVLLAAANNALTRSAIADSLSPILSMICSKNITGSFRSRKTFQKCCIKTLRKTALKFTVRGRKIYKTFADFTLC